MQAREQADRRERLWIIGPFVVSIVLLAGLCVLGFQMLSAARAFVGGESLWSKARARAVASLRDYVQSGADADGQRFESALAVPLGDRHARLALDASPPDLERAREGFEAGGNAADDIDGMIRLYRHFGRTAFMRESVAAWVEGDRMIDELRALGLEAGRHIGDGERGEALAPLRERIDALDLQVGRLEMRFSAALGEASRRTERLLALAMLLLALGLALAAARVGVRVLQRQQAQRRLLAEANRRWTLAADGAGIGVFEWREGRDSCTMDRRARNLFALWDDSETVNLPLLRERIVAEDRAGLRELLSSGKDRHGELLRHRFRVGPDPGQTRYLEVAALMLPTPSRLVGIVRDVDDEVRQRALQLEKEAAERVAQLRMDFLSRLSHELRTPLNAVLGLGQLLHMDRQDPLSAEQARRVGIILDSGAHLLRLVEDVLDISHIDAGKLKLGEEAVDLHAVIEAGLRLVEPERARCEVQVEHRLAATPPAVRGDRQRLEQVLVNLLSNACKYNRRGGRLGIETSASGGEVRVTISDEGAGLGPEQQAQLFVPFQRPGAPAAVSGTGLGLVVVKMLVEAMGGRVEVDSAPGHGSRFGVVLRAA